jgi:glycosyltransferase involved in cell wall biosynthesis
LKIVKKMPLISIITVVYNGEKYLEQTIESVINQTYKNIEYIIIDGGSTDGTHDIIKKYSENISYFISEPDKGLYDAMNKGINVAKGELIGMINSDDWLEVNAINLIVEIYKDNPTKKVFHGDLFYISNTKVMRKFNPSFIKMKYYGMTYNHPTMYVHRDVYSEFKYNFQLKVKADYQFVLSCLFRKVPMYYIPEAYVNYRVDGISAQLTLKQTLKESNIAKREAGVNFFQRLIGFSVLLSAHLLYRGWIKNRIKVLFNNHI